MWETTGGDWTLELFEQVVNYKDIDGEYPKEFVDIINEFNNRIVTK